MTVWDIGSVPSKGKNEGERVTTKIFPRVFQPDEEASPEVGQPKRPKRSAWETKLQRKGNPRERLRRRCRRSAKIREFRLKKFATPLQYRSSFSRLLLLLAIFIARNRRVQKYAYCFARKKKHENHNPSFRSRLLPLQHCTGTLVPSRNRITLWACSRGSRMNGGMRGEKKGGKKRKGASDRLA